MIEVLTRLHVKEKTITMSGKTDEKKRTIELYCHTSEYPWVSDQSVVYAMSGIATFVDIDSKPYTA